MNSEIDFTSVSDKDLQDLERLSRELLNVLRKAKASDTTLAKLLGELESGAGKHRRMRFDAKDSEYNPQ